jgi:hypothetical protein
MTYDRRAIMTQAHRSYEHRVGAVRAAVAEHNGKVARLRRHVKPASRDLFAELRSLWRECLRRAWGNAKTEEWKAARLAQVLAQTAVDRVRDALRFEEAADRGYDARRAATLRAQLTTLTEDRSIMQTNGTLRRVCLWTLTNDPVLVALFRRLDDEGAVEMVPTFRPRPSPAAAAPVHELVWA